jgi:hypothetical protein
MDLDASTIFAIIAAAIAFRVIVHFADKNRIQHEVEGRGGRIVSIKWNPFARGWFFEKGERHYDLMYVDRSGAAISTTCKTSFFTGVYWAEGPTVTEPQRMVPRRRCLGCGYALNVEWRACPNCGKATDAA